MKVRVTSVWLDWFGPAFATGAWFGPVVEVVEVVDVVVIVVLVETGVVPTVTVAVSADVDHVPWLSRTHRLTVYVPVVV